jgi:hypothetical protein
MDEQRTTGSSGFLPSAVPWPVWLLLAGALVQLGVKVAPDSYSVFGPYFLVHAGMVLDWVNSISLFLLAAAVVLAADRWPGGRRTLLMGAGALAIVALLRLGLDAWMAVWEASGHVYDPSPPFVLGMHLGAGVMFVTAHVLLAAGLWAGRSPAPMGRTRSLLVAMIGLGGLIATGAGLWAVVLTLPRAQPDYAAYAVVIMTLTAVSFVALGLLAMAAARVTPRHGGIPEKLIAVGASVTLAATAWASIGPYFTPGPGEVSEDGFLWVYTLPYAAGIAGTLTTIAGFGLAALAVHRARTADGSGG